MSNTSSLSSSLSSMLIVLVFILIASVDNCKAVDHCFIMPFLKSRADIELLQVTTVPDYFAILGEYVTSTMKFRLKSGKIKTARLRSHVFKGSLKLYSYDKIVDKTIIGHDLPLGPGFYTITVKQEVFDFSPLGVYSTKTELFINGKISQCLLKDIFIKRPEE